MALASPASTATAARRSAGFRAVMPPPIGRGDCDSKSRLVVVPVIVAVASSFPIGSKHLLYKLVVAPGLYHQNKTDGLSSLSLLRLDNTSSKLSRDYCAADRNDTTCPNQTSASKPPLTKLKRAPKKAVSPLVQLSSALMASSLAQATTCACRKAVPHFTYPCPAIHCLVALVPDHARLRYPLWRMRVDSRPPCTTALPCTQRCRPVICAREHVSCTR